MMKKSKGLDKMPFVDSVYEKWQRVENTERLKIALPTMRGRRHIRLPDRKEGVTESTAGHGAQQVC